jgi:3-deoxy-D-manno-octulosonic-acid transferase
VPSHPLPADARRSLLLYNLLFPVAFLALLPGALSRIFKRGGYREKFGQRFGRYSTADRERFARGEWIWLHSISVGETLLALQLARKIHELAPGKSVVISVTTSTGFGIAQPHVSSWLEVIYNPLDARSIVQRALDVVRPERLIFLVAIWPNLLATAKRRGLPVTFLPRLSPRSEARFRRFRGIAGPLFRLIDAFAAPEPEDVARWALLGVDPSRVEVTGNVKFDATVSDQQRVGEFRALLTSLGIGDDAPVLLAGSTFPGEERILGEAYQQLRTSFPKLFLIVVPRHVERSGDAIRDLEGLGLRPVRRTALPATGKPDVLVIDTTGELRDWYHLATVVFIGKSLAATGGQNPVEAVLAGKPVIFGPHMENFAPIVQRWLAADAAVQIAAIRALLPSLEALFSDPARRHSLAHRAREIAAHHEGATTRTARRLLGLEK